MADHIEQAALLIAHPKMTRPAKLHPDCPVCQNAMATVRQLADAGLLADPAQTIELAIARCQTSCDDDCEAPCHEAHEVLIRRHHDVDECEAGQRRWSEVRAERDGYYRQWMSTRETVHKRTAERDALSLLLRGMARKLVAYRKWTSGETPTIHRLFDALRREADTADDITLSAIRLMNRAGQERDQAIAERDVLLPRLAELAEQAGKLRTAEWLRACALLPLEEWPPAPAYKGPMVAAAELDALQARLDRACAILGAHDQPDGVGKLIEDAMAALQGDQPEVTGG